MGFTDSMKKWIGLEEIDEDEMITEEEVNAAKEQMTKERKDKTPDAFDLPAAAPRKKSAPAARSSEKRFGTVNTGAFRMVLIEPKNFEACPKLVDSLKGRKPVIINLEKIETDEARKIFDFMSGATYALNGNVQKVANNIFIFAPENVDISSNENDRASYDFSKDESINWR